MARQGTVLVASFHPELTDETTVHDYFARHGPLKPELILRRFLLDTSCAVLAILWSDQSTSDGNSGSSIRARR